MSECAPIGRCAVVLSAGFGDLLGDWFDRNEQGERRVLKRYKVSESLDTVDQDAMPF